MITVYVSLDCAAPTRDPDGRFATLVAVTESEFLREVHVRRAMRRAAILGCPGPYHVAYVHRHDAPMSLDEIRARLQRMTDHRRERLLSIVDQAQNENPSSASVASVRRAQPKRRRMRGL